MDFSETIRNAIRKHSVTAEEHYERGHIAKWKTKREEAIETLEKNGFEYLGQGEYRKVFSTPKEDIVLKIAKNNSGGKKENKAEIRNWIDASEKARERLATIYSYDEETFLWHTQEKVDSTRGTKEDAERINSLLKESGMEIREVAKYNIGEAKDGKILLYDFGGIF